MEYCHNGILIENTGSGVPHDSPDSFSHGWLETVNWAFGASRLAFLVRAFVEAFMGVVHKRCTFGA